MMPNGAPTTHRPHLERIVITTGDGRVYNLGKPEHVLIGDRLFQWRRRRYIKSRRAEFKAAGMNVEEMLRG